MIDYEAITTTLTTLIKDQFNIAVVQRDSSQKQPTYPFCTYSIISPYLRVSISTQDNTTTEDVEIVYSFTFTSDEKGRFQILSMAQQCASLFETPGTQQYLYDNGLSFVRIDGFTSRDTFMSIESERKMGFDVRIRTRHVTQGTMDMDVIETTNI